MTESYQNWIWHTLYYLERRNAPKDKIIGMVKEEELIQTIRELEEEEWERATDLEKEEGDVNPPRTKVQIANSIKGLRGRTLIREYKNKDGIKCLRTS